MIFSLFCLQLLLKQVIDLFVVDTKHFVCNHLRTLNLFNLNFYKFSPSDFTASQSCKCFDVFSHHTYLKLEHLNYQIIFFFFQLSKVHLQLSALPVNCLIFFYLNQIPQIFMLKNVFDFKFHGSLKEKSSMTSWYTYRRVGHL